MNNREGKNNNEQKCLEMNAAKTEQDLLTKTRGSHCLIVSGSQKNAYSRHSRRVLLSHQLQRLICVREKQETQRPNLRGGWRSFVCGDAPVRAGRDQRPTWEVVSPGWRPKNEKPQRISIRLITWSRRATCSDASSGENTWIQTVIVTW